MALKAVQVTPTTLDQVTAQMIEQLNSGEWTVGSKLPSEAALSQEMNVSRSVVREAIRGLARLGMLDPVHGSGTYVRTRHSPTAMLEGLDHAGVAEIFEVQMAYDVQAAGLAAERHTAAQLRRLRKLLAKRDASESDRSDPLQFAVDDSEFHLAIAEIAGNPLLHETYKYFVGRLRDGLYLVHSDTAIPSCGHESHAAIVDAIASRDVAAARAAAYEVVSMAIASIGIGDRQPSEEQR
ncbi:FadR/GntR family transcriptional regulator [Rhodococcus sp. HNM0569]|uniref:FadR/GntR family transcriptional regulator n=1 Tax=Rhodococcus sp. HNM0569 TaxID=2716340 RepID=UPI00146D5C4F|nr:FadR/GntR family transcriptional regulator [Rhodococcus sp. HNM0569]NLU82687.1 FadR family transcriptional regulator [Rhodococcus sp. HNM0569]